MKSLEEYRKELEKDPKARRRLKKLEKEFQQVEDSLTEEELVKYGLKPAPNASDATADASDATAKASDAAAEAASDADDTAAASVLDRIARKI